MNKKVYGIVIVVLFIGLGIFFIAGTQYGLAIKHYIIPLGTMRAKVDSPKTANSAIGLEAKKGDKLRFEYSSNVKEGNLKINLSCSGKVIENFDTNIKGKKKVVIDDAMDVKLWVEQEEFKGDFKVKVYK